MLHPLSGLTTCLGFIYPGLDPYLLYYHIALIQKSLTFESNNDIIYYLSYRIKANPLKSGGAKL